MSLMDVKELVMYGADDLLFFGRSFFPNTFKKASPDIHVEMAELIDGPDNGQAAIFRGGAKTSLTRVACAKKVSYGESKVTLVVGKGQDHAIKTILWLQNQIENNPLWANAFGICKAMNPDTGRPKKWTDEWITVENKVLGTETHFIAYGITGQIRGMNINDARPDFIICDDILDDENCATPEQRAKIKSRFWGALMKSLARKEENPLAKCILLQTPIDQEDLSMDIRKLDSWVTQVHSCFDEEGNSTWEDQFSTESLKEEKKQYIQMNQLSVWMREMEVNPTASELRLFRPEWLQYFEHIPQDVIYIMSCDPTPPPKDKEERDPQKLDDAVIMVCGFQMSTQRMFVADYYTTKSPQTTELVYKFFEYHKKYRPVWSGLETILFARTIKESLETHMHRTGYFFEITPIEDKRKKFVRIKDTLQARASNGLIAVREEQTGLVSQFVSYPQVKHDDILDALSLCALLINPALLAAGNVYEGEFVIIDDDAPMLDFRGAP